MLGRSLALYLPLQALQVTTLTGVLPLNIKHFLHSKLSKEDLSSYAAFPLAIKVCTFVTSGTKPWEWLSSGYQAKSYLKEIQRQHLSWVFFFPRIWCVLLTCASLCRMNGIWQNSTVPNILLVVLTDKLRQVRNLEVMVHVPPSSANLN